ncbi:MAG: amino acid ABC transporter ATP-binding protein [Phycisphaeraceae bacterium]|nr:amino acid ABC transporter ATP-binding protein [Phycisphaeraceae bacterium]
MIRCVDLYKSYGHTRVLGGVSFSVDSGQILAVLGSSGTGKSTLLRVLSGVEGFDQGHLVVDGCRLEPGGEAALSQEELWPNITMVFQDLFLWPHLTNRENLLLPARNRHGSKAEEICNALIERLDLSGFIDRHPNEASRGQRQIVAVARALALKPRVLLLDEVTASLDMSRAVALTAALREVAQSGTTILHVTHQLGFARHTADSIMFLENGAVAEFGSIDILNTPASSGLQAFVALANRAN